MDKKLSPIEVAGVDLIKKRMSDLDCGIDDANAEVIITASLILQALRRRYGNV